MSFTATVKDEVSKLDIVETEKISELSAIVQNSDYSDGIRIVTENNAVARLVYSLFKDLFNVHSKVSVKRGYNYNKNLLHTLSLNFLLIDYNSTELHPSVPHLIYFRQHKLQ